MKIVAFILALAIGLIVWFFTFGIIFSISGLRGIIPYMLLIILPIYFIVKFLYKFFINKFGYKIIEEDKNKEK
ncbi:hypothetical protein [Campylobacter geochelonis]|uniref:Uncharacterized protein n=1 Tax=Campylobacter geochelonis TaxID=1780362 RepID=A0A128EGB6_9BACT|nr:hypothetical protein [Campylobacter geochelonis]QKF71076.1 hypothetical protein CGEO_0756 [Campylobacter geochelonis]CZE47263.1 Uncharacterised protein [Campylobacter geochelonis]CZE50108.1 Uncharacterised protein [Campylobacter geochelonis]